MLIIPIKDGENIERALKRYKNKYRNFNARFNNKYYNF